MRSKIFLFLVIGIFVLLASDTLPQDENKIIENTDITSHPLYKKLISDGVFEEGVDNTKAFKELLERDKIQPIFPSYSGSSALYGINPGNTPQLSESFIYIEDFLQIPNPHGVLVAPDDRIWILPYARTEEMPVDIDGDDVPDIWEPCRAIYCYNEDGTQASFSPITIIDYQGRQDTLWDSNRGLSLHNDGSILVTTWENFYRLEHITGECTGWIDLSVFGAPTEAASDMYNNIYVGGVGANKPIHIYNSDLEHIGNVRDMVSHLSRGLVVTPDGKDIYSGAIYSGTNGVIHYHSDNGPSGPYTEVNTLGTDGTYSLWAQSLDWGPDANIWVGTYWDVAPQDPNGWYSMNPATGQFEDSIGVNIRGNFYDFPQPAQGSYIYAPRGITWSNDGHYAYTADFDGGVIKKWRYVQKSQIYLPEFSHDFSLVEVDSSKSWIMRIFNRSTDTLIVSDITNSLSQFRIGDTYQVLGAKDSTGIEIEFFPADTIEYIDTLFIHSSDTLMPVVKVALRGKGWYPPDISIIPDTLLEALLTGSTAQQIMLIENIGEGRLEYNTSVINTSQNYAIEFDGNDDYIDLQKSIPDLSEMTVQAWVYYKGGYNTGTVFMDASTEGGNDFLLDMNSSGIGIRADKGQASLNYEDVQAISGLDLGNSWHCIAWTMTSSVSKIYLDGNLIRTINEPGSNVGYHAENPAIGRWWDGWYAWKFFRGIMDEIRIWNVVKSQAELQSEMHGEIPGNDPALVGYWRFNEGSGNKAFDQSNNGNHGTLMEGAKWVVSMNSFAPSWITVNPDQGSIASNSAQNIEVNFDALGLFGGTYTADITIESNDPYEPVIIVPAVLEVTGAPNIQVESDTIAFGQVFNGVTKSVTFIVQNSGTDDLLISSVVAQPNDFTVAPAFAGIDAREIEEFTVEFAPQSIAEIHGTLTFNSNDPDESSLVIHLSGEGVEPPIIVVTPDSITDVLFSNQTVNHAITIDNTQGGSNLIWNIELENVGLGTATFTKPDYSDWTIPEYQDQITENVWITRANQNGLFNAATESEYNYGSPDDTEWAYGLTKDLSPADYNIWRDAVYPPPGMVGQPLSLHLISDDKYFDVMFHSWTSQANGGGFSYTRTDISPRWIELSEDAGIVAAGSTIEIEVTINTAGLFSGDYSGNIIVVSNDPVTPEYKVPVSLNVTGVPDIDVSLARFDSTSTITYNTYDATTLHTFKTPFAAVGAGKLYVTLQGDFDNSSEYADIYMDGEMIGTFNPGTPGPVTREFGLSESLLNGYVADGTVLVTIDNSPAVGSGSENDFHAVRLSYSGANDTLDFGEVYVYFYESFREIFIANTGTDILRISSIAVDNEAFSLSHSSLNINYGEVEKVEVVFHPNLLETYTATLTIISDDPDQGTIEIPLTGIGVAPPVISVKPDSLIAEVNSGEIKSTTLRIYNRGGSELHFEILTYQSAGANANYALQFDGFNDLMSTTRDYINPDEYTLEMWFKSNTTTGGNLISFEDIQSGYSAQSDHLIYMNNSGYINFGVFLYGEKEISSPESYNDNQWHHVAATLSQTGMFLYIDGSLAANDPYTTSGENFPGFWRIGSGTVDYWPNAPSSSYFKGMVDEIRIWNTARTESQILENKNITLNGNEAGLTSYWRLDESEGNTVFDLSSSKNHGVLNGGISRVISTAPVSPGWLKCVPGSGDIAANDSIDIDVTFDATELIDDSYEGRITIQCNDPNEPQIAIPVFLSLIPSEIDDLLTNEIPKTYILYQNYPNPFNPATQIRFGLPKPGKVLIELFNILGQKTATILDENKSAGYHTITFDGSKYASGVYVYRMRTDNFLKSMKMLLIR